jgi:hypothetical protein
MNRAGRFVVGVGATTIGLVVMAVFVLWARRAIGMHSASRALLVTVMGLPVFGFTSVGVYLWATTRAPWKKGSGALVSGALLLMGLISDLGRVTPAMTVLEFAFASIALLWGFADKLDARFPSKDDRPTV